MLKICAAAAGLALAAAPARAETWHVMAATPAELLMMETDSRVTLPNGDVSVWTSSVKLAEPDEPIVKAQWQVACAGQPRIRPRMIIWFDADQNNRESWQASARDRFKPIVPGSRGELTWQFACGKKFWPMAMAGSFEEMAGAYANAVAKLVTATSLADE